MSVSDDRFWWTALASLALAGLLGGCEQDANIGDPAGDAWTMGQDAGAETGGVDVTDAGAPDVDDDREVGVDATEDVGSEAGSDADDDPDRPETDLGASCDQDRDCEMGSCLDEGHGFPGGYCDSNDVGCDIGDCRGAGGRCVQRGNWGTYCARTCDDSLEDCRPGWSCREKPHGDTKVCRPLEGNSYGYDGARCLRDAACLGGTCKTGGEWQEGYCTDASCESDSDCHPSRSSSPDRAICAGEDSEYASMCLRTCGIGGCREGYHCAIGVLPDRPTESVCVPGESPEHDEDFSAYPFDVTCTLPGDESFDIEFNIDSETTSFMPVLVGQDGLVSVDTYRRPSGPIEPAPGVRDESNLYFRARSSRTYASLNPPAPQRSISSGTHGLEGETNAEELCYWVLEESSAGTEVDLNFYFVGTDQHRGLGASNASSHQAFQEALSRASSVLSAADLGVGEVRYEDVTGSEARRHMFISDASQLDSLFSLGARPGSTADEALSLDVYVVMGLNYDSLAGVAGAVGGPAGLHGTSMSGIAIEVAYLDLLPRTQVGGEVLAHEIGHYLGLYHTTDPEDVSWPTDPLADTEECPESQFPSGCPDAGNLMFPQPSGATEITADQTAVLQAHPLSKD